MRPRSRTAASSVETQAKRSGAGGTLLQRRMTILATGGIAPSRSARTLSCRTALRPLRPSTAPRSLFCVHGSAVAGKSWNALAAPLRDHVVVLAPDRLGQAPGERWPADRPTSFDAEAEHLAAALAAAPGPVHLFGHSYGGAVAMQMALRWPERVARLTLYEPTRFALLLHAGQAIGEAGQGDPGDRSWHPRARRGRAGSGRGARCSSTTGPAPAPGRRWTPAGSSDSRCRCPRSAPNSWPPSPIRCRSMPGARSRCRCCCSAARPRRRRCAPSTPCSPRCCRAARA